MDFESPPPQSGAQLLVCHRQSYVGDVRHGVSRVPGACRGWSFERLAWRAQAGSEQTFSALSRQEGGGQIPQHAA